MSNKRKYYHYKSGLAESMLALKKLIVNSKHTNKGEECNLNLKHKLLVDVSKNGISLWDEFRYREDDLVTAVKRSSSLYLCYYFYFNNMSDALLFKLKYPEITFLNKIP
jgi:hypothetical protein